MVGETQERQSDFGFEMVFFGDDSQDIQLRYGLYRLRTKSFVR